MKKGFEIWFAIIFVSCLLLVNTLAGIKAKEEARDEAYKEGYNSGYAAAEQELVDNGKTYLDGYEKGYADGRESGLDAARVALEDPDGIVAEFILSGDYEDSALDSFISKWNDSDYINTIVEND